MLCQNCGKNEANIRYTQIINGVKKQMNLCEHCAKELGVDDISFNMPSIDLSNFLGGMFDDDIQEIIPSLIKPETLICNKCGSSYEDFIRNGKFGCDECYETFQNQIDSLLKNIHGVNRHIGRIGTGKEINKNEGIIGKKVEKQNKEKRAKEEEKNTIKKEKDSKSKLEELQERLKQEIKEERYEDAAKTRDEIKRIQNN